MLSITSSVSSHYGIARKEKSVSTVLSRLLWTLASVTFTEALLPTPCRSQVYPADSALVAGSEVNFTHLSVISIQTQARNQRPLTHVWVLDCCLVLCVSYSCVICGWEPWDRNSVFGQVDWRTGAHSWLNDWDCQEGVFFIQGYGGGKGTRLPSWTGEEWHDPAAFQHQAKLPADGGMHGYMLPAESACFVTLPLWCVSTSANCTVPEVGYVGTEPATTVEEEICQITSADGKWFLPALGICGRVC